MLYRTDFDLNNFESDSDYEVYIDESAEEPTGKPTGKPTVEPIQIPTPPQDTLQKPVPKKPKPIPKVETDETVSDPGNADGTV